MLADSALGDPDMVAGDENSPDLGG